MRIAVPAVAPDLDAEVDRRLGACAYLLVVDPETLVFDAIPASPDSAGAGGGIRMIALVVSKEVRVILARYVSPHVAERLREQGIEVLTGIEGTVREAINRYKRGEERPAGALPRNRLLLRALGRSARQFGAILPVLLGVVLLIGLFKTVISKEALASVFSGEPFTDTLWGACLGSILAGNPINSYVIGKTLLDAGVSLFAVTALMVTWVTVGLVQLPAEISALGGRFAISRNLAAFLLSLPIALLTVILVRCL
jgi:predicted Fe-Mo cluster-binding NifX family protein